MTSDERVEAVISAMVLHGQAECSTTGADLPEFAMATVSMAVRMMIACSPSIEVAKESMVFVMNDLFSQAERDGESVN